MSKGELPLIQFASQETWEEWLEEHHAISGGVWIQFAKKGSGHILLSYPEAVESALCFGWIDGQAASVDEQFWRQRFTPRRARSKWSEINCKKATELIAHGRMRTSGLNAVEAARKDGRWDNAYKSQRTMLVPEDLQKCLDERPQAREFFGTLNSRNRYAILYRIQDAKKPETRARRIDKFVTMLEERKTIY